MKNQLVFKNHDRGFEVAKALLDEGNVVLLSYEEEFLIINWEWCESGYADRNEVVFRAKWEDEERDEEIMRGLLDDIRNDIKSGFYKDLSDI